MRGFTLLELLIVVALVGVVAAVSTPLIMRTIDTMRLRMATRDVERELQAARLKAVSANRAMRVRFNCPSTGRYRVVELIGTPGAPDGADTSADRCSDSLYPYPAADRNPLTRPNNDGPLRQLPPSVSFGSVQTIEFRPDGTAHTNSTGANPWPVIPVAGVEMTILKAGSTKTISVNGLGKIQMR